MWSRRIQFLETEIARLTERLTGLDRLTDEKFMTYEAVLSAQAKNTALALDASKEAIDKAERSTERAIEKTAADVQARFASVNEFRQTLSDQATTFIPRKEAEQQVSAISERMELSRAQMDERLKSLEQNRSRMGGSIAAVGAVLAAVVIVVNVAIALLT